MAASPPPINKGVSAAKMGADMASPSAFSKDRPRTKNDSLSKKAKRISFLSGIRNFYAQTRNRMVD
jgi:hypothetical protein